MKTIKVVEVCRDCAYAEKKQFHGGYNFKCLGCRDRLLKSEICKLKRETLAKMLRKWGEVPEWKIEPHCGCTKSCKRRQYQRGE